MAGGQSKTMANTLIFFVNGKRSLEFVRFVRTFNQYYNTISIGQKVEDPNPDPSLTLLTYLRSKLKLTGTKLACGEGGCGACTVMVSKLGPDDQMKHFSLNACLAPICSVHGMAVTTVEGIGSVRYAFQSVLSLIWSANFNHIFQNIDASSSEGYC